MCGRLVLGLSLLALVTAVAGASAASWRAYRIQTGGFAIALPASWIDARSASSAAIKTLSADPSVRLTTELASRAGAIELLAVDPAAAGRVYLDSWAVRIGSAKLPALEAAIVQRLALLTPGKAAASTAALPTGQADVVQLDFKQAGSVERSIEYVFIRDEVGYVLAFGAPKARWSTYGPLFERSARSFRFVKGPDLTHVILSGAQVGSGYTLATVPGGDSVIGEATLDLCDRSYPSERLRDGRLQVEYTHPGAAVGVSNEVVTYLPGGADQALKEVTSVAHACARKAVVISSGGVTTTFRTTLLHVSKLLPGAVAVQIHTTAKRGKQHAEETTVAVYQVKGDTLSGVYAFVAKGTTTADAIRICFHAAAQSARNLGGLSLSA